jgi:hypothetical protein
VASRGIVCEDEGSQHMGLDVKNKRMRAV